MGTGYVRNDTPNNIADGNVINASDLDGEFDAVQAAFNASTGHSHDGTAGEGPQIAAGGLASNAVTTVKITDANVTLAKMAANSVDSDQYVDGSIDTAHIADNAVTAAKLDETGTYTVAGLTTTGDVSFGDNDKAIFGAESDLQIYHNGSNSYVKDTGAGYLILGNSDVGTAIQNGSGQNLILTSANAVTLSYGNASKLATANNGVVITGRMDSDTVKTSFISNNVATGALSIGGGAAYNTGANILMYGESHGQVGAHIFRDGTTYRLRIAGNSGDISFYDNTGVSQGFYWDADQQSLGLGTTTPSSYGELAVYKASGNVEAAVVAGGANYATYRVQNNAQRYSMQIRTDQSNAFVVRDETAGANRFVVDTSGNVGINTTTMDSGLNIKQSADNAYQLKLEQHNTTDGYGLICDMTDGALAFSRYASSAYTERMRIDSSGNVGIGMTNPNSYGRLAVMTPTTGYGYFGIGNSVGGGGGVNIGSYYGTTKISYIDTVLENGTPSSEQSRLQFATISGGTLAERMRIDSSGVDVTGTVTMDGGSTSADFSFGDNDKAIFGAGSDLQIYHDASESIIEDVGNGDLKVRGSDEVKIQVRNAANTAWHNAVVAADAGAVSLYHNNSPKLATTSYGIDISGSVVADTQTASKTGSQTPDFNTYQNFLWTLTGNITLANPTTEKQGQTGFFIFIHSGGARTVSLQGQYGTAGGAGLTLSSTAGAVDIVPYVVRQAGYVYLGTPQLAFS